MCWSRCTLFLSVSLAELNLSVNFYIKCFGSLFESSSWISIHVCTYMCACIYVHVWAQPDMLMCSCVYMYVYILVFVYACIYTYASMWVCTYMYSHICCVRDFSWRDATDRHIHSRKGTIDRQSNSCTTNGILLGLLAGIWVKSHWREQEWLKSSCITKWPTLTLVTMHSPQKLQSWSSPCHDEL